MVGGAFQFAAGALAIMTPEPTMVTKVVGGIAVVHGADDFLTGARQLMSGREESSATQTIATEAADLAMDRPNAEAFGRGTDIALGFVSPVGGGPTVLRGTVPALVSMEARGARAVAVVPRAVEVTLTAETVRTVQAISALQHVMMAAHGGDDGGSSSSSSGSSASSSTEPNSSQIPDEYFDEAMSRIDEGDLRATGAHLDDLTSHAQSSAARAERGISGQSAHISARSAMRNLASYDPRAALTRILDVVTHRGFDDYWKGIFRQMAHTSGESTIAVRDYFNVMRDAIGNNPYFSTQEANSMIELLRDELFVQHGLRDSDLLRLPYSR